MTSPHPVYRDDDYLYTLARGTSYWAITMIPVSEGLRGTGHIIEHWFDCTPDQAARFLHRYAREKGLRWVITTGRKDAV